MTVGEWQRKVASSRTAPKKIILGTDWWTDCDDCVALRIMTRAHKSGLIELLGVGINGCMEFSAPSVNAFLTFDGLGDIPVGIDLDGTDFSGSYHAYQRALCDYPHSIASNGQCESAVRLYRRLLSGIEGKADIVEIGFAQILSQLILSEADDISPLSGEQLVAQKVGTLWMMAGKWDEQPGHEHNFNNNRRSALAAHTLCEKWNGEIVFLGFEVGLSVITGGSVKGHDDILATALKLHGSENGRNSWDPMTAVLAVTDDLALAGYTSVRGTASVSPENGENRFTLDENGKHSYVVKTMPDSFYSEIIDGIII